MDNLLKSVLNDDPVGFKTEFKDMLKTKYDKTYKDMQINIAKKFVEPKEG
jgi:hypothetical protein